MYGTTCTTTSQMLSKVSAFMSLFVHYMTYNLRRQSININHYSFSLVIYPILAVRFRDQNLDDAYIYESDADVRERILLIRRVRVEGKN